MLLRFLGYSGYSDIDTHVHVGGTPPAYLEFVLYACNPSVPFHKDPWCPMGKKEKEKRKGLINKTFYIEKHSLLKTPPWHLDFGFHACNHSTAMDANNMMREFLAHHRTELLRNIVRYVGRKINFGIQKKNQIR